jgi:hypothetical protein
LAGIGAGLIVVSIPFYSTANKRAKQAVAAFNRGAAVQSNIKIGLNLNFSMNEVGFALKF